MNAVTDFSKSTLSSFQPGPGSLTTAQRVARGLGWFSLALGLIEVAAPGRLARALGLEGKENLLRGYGAREIGAGVGALSIDPGPAIWSRVGGDALDLATLALGLKGGDERQRKYAIGAIAAVAAITALDVVTASKLSAERKRDAPPRNYASRSGFPKGAANSRGLAADLQVPADMRAAPSVAR